MSPIQLCRAAEAHYDGGCGRSAQLFCTGNISVAFNVHWSVHRKNIPIYIKQNATLHSLFYLETALHVLGATTTHHQERKQLYLQHLVSVRPLLLPAATAGFDPRTVQPVASRYTDYATRPTLNDVMINK
jgi:hypothetical protein